MQYTPLDPKRNQIRLLRLQSASNDEEIIRCQTITVSLDDRTVEYEALSYVWGDRTNDETIKLNGAPRAVTANLFQALVNFRYPDRERMLWIDAICIDQDNLDERSEQVSRMGAIFSQASMVLIWLGQAWPDVSLAFDFFRGLGGDLVLHSSPGRAPSIAAHGFDIESPGLRKTIKCFMTSTWWSRIWTVQEYALARSSRFYCGKYSIDSDLVYQSLLNFYHPATYATLRSDIVADLKPHFQLFIHLEGLGRRAIHEKRHSLRLIGLFRGRQATDPRDKIYGLQALATDRYASTPNANYRVTVERLYESWALSIIQETGNLDVLSHVVSNTRRLRLPSWVPDWTIPMGNATVNTESRI